METIVAKCLLLKQLTTSKSRKHLVKRPYVVSVTNVDVLTEPITKQYKKNNNELRKKNLTICNDAKSSKNNVQM